MKKKIVSMFLAILMLVPAFAFAETPNVYTFEGEPGYTITLPDGWIAISKENTEKLMEAGASILDDETLQSYIAQVQQMNMVMFFSSNMLQTANIVLQDGMPDLPADVLVQAVAPTLVEQYETLFPGCTITNPGEVFTAGTNQFLKMSLVYSLAGNDIHATLYIIIMNGCMASVTYGDNQGDVEQQAAFEQILDTFAIAR